MLTIDIDTYAKIYSKFIIGINIKVKTIKILEKNRAKHSNPRRKGNKGNPDWKRSKALTVCRWHGTIHRKP